MIQFTAAVRSDPDDVRIGKDNLESEVPNVVFVQISKEEDSERVLVNMLCGLSEDYKIKSVTIL